MSWYCSQDSKTREANTIPHWLHLQELFPTERLMQFPICCISRHYLLFCRFKQKTRKANTNPYLLLFQALKFPTVKQKIFKKGKKRLAQTPTYCFSMHYYYQILKKEANADPYLLHFQALKFSRVKQKTEKAKISYHFLHFQALKFPRYKGKTQERLIQTPTGCISRH